MIWGCLTASRSRQGHFASICRARASVSRSGYRAFVSDQARVGITCRCLPAALPTGNRWVADIRIRLELTIRNASRNPPLTEMLPQASDLSPVVVQRLRRLIQSADIGQLSDSSADALFSEIDAKSKMNPIWPIPLVVAAVLAMLVAANDAESANRAMLVVGLMAFIAVILATVWLYLWDSARRSVVLIYDLEQDSNQSYERMLAGFDEMRTCNRAWRVEAEGRVLDGRYHAGAGSQVIRKAASMGYGNVATIKCNIDVPSITAGRMRFFFYPDRILMKDGKRIAACSYQSLEAESGQTQFIESDNVPSDAEVIGHTWRFVNRNGSPDRRFKDNRQIPVVRYETLRLSTPQGVREMFHFSRLGCSGRFSALVSKDLAALGIEHV